jgi:hypothetical protein
MTYSSSSSAARYTISSRSPAHQHPVLDEGAVVGQLGVGLGDDVLLLLVGGQVHDLVGHPTVDDLAVRRLDEAIGVDAPVGGQVADQADVRAFRSLDRAHAAVMGSVHVPDLEPGPFTGQTSRAHGGEAPLVGEPTKRIRLVHELGQL